MSDLLKTPLHDWHVNNGAKMGEFAGWNMPIQYEKGIIAEHLHTRSKASIFDICHMGQFLVRGTGSLEALSKAVTHKLDTLAVGKCRYGFLLNEEGGILDDLIIYRLGEAHFLLVVNAGCLQNDFTILKSRLGKISIEDITPHAGKIDLQGPHALEVLEDVTGENFHDLAYFSFRHIMWKGVSLTVSRTGYTGELGYELYPPRGMTQALWETLLAHPSVAPAGLGARDTLRLEAGLPLYGHELDTEHTPSEASMQSMLTSTADYVGKEGALANPRYKLIALQADGKRAARAGDLVSFAADTDRVVGKVTSGSYAPSLNASIAFAYIKAEYDELDDDIEFLLKAAKVNLVASKIALPFYKEGTARIKIS